MDAPRTRRAGRIALATAGSALLSTTLAACGGGAEPNASPSLVPGASSGARLTIGIPVDEPGIGMKDGDTYSGFDVEVAKKLDIRWAKQRKAIAVREDSRRVYLIVADPLDIGAQDDVRAMFGKAVDVTVAPTSVIIDAVNAFFERLESNSDLEKEDEE